MNFEFFSYCETQKSGLSGKFFGKVHFLSKILEFLKQTDAVRLSFRFSLLILKSNVASIYLLFGSLRQDRCCVL
jgi:uncharacterized membrane protein (UPF0136 family)